ncbi:aldo/keto reductase [Sphingomonas gilva]|uniref:Aldo/keto reductase n=2 Tax=Sphingomonas gilva TaxID=2305907 RepID=A0A396RVK2_9SPHN|nr:aldo/keto reductase [Sphingomonas gilva]
MGTAGIGNLYAPVSNAVAEATVAAAWEGGVRLFDTAPYYGFGLAERRLGAALSVVDPDQTAIISTKVGRVLDPDPAPARERHGFVNGDRFAPRFDYSRDAVLRSHEASLERLRRDRVNILLAHDLGALTHGAQADAQMRAFLDDGYRTMVELKDAGAVDAIGIGANEVAVCEYLVDRVDLDVVMIAGRYTLLDCEAGERLLPLCLERGVRVIAAAPYNSGILAQPIEADAPRRYDYIAAPAGMLRRAAAIGAVCARFGVELPTAALHFAHRDAAVASVVAGMVGRDEVAAHLGRAAADVPDALWQALAEEAMAA